jgi:hypothetical protein
MTRRGPAHAGPLYFTVQAICERLNSARLPFEPTAVTVTLSHSFSPRKLASKVPSAPAVASARLLCRPLAASRTFSPGWKPVPCTVRGPC